MLDILTHDNSDIRELVNHLKEKYAIFFKEVFNSDISQFRKYSFNFGMQTLNHIMVSLKKDGIEGDAYYQTLGKYIRAITVSFYELFKIEFDISRGIPNTRIDEIKTEVMEHYRRQYGP